jgi:N-acetylmuramic acid 6-phosphate etherase
LSTEARNPRTVGLDRYRTVDLVGLLIDEQAGAVEVVTGAREPLSTAVDEAAKQLLVGGRLIYLAAGTSAWLAAADAAELRPTFGFSDTVVIRPAGGTPHFDDNETEDDFSRAQERVMALSVRAEDVVLAVTASGTTPFVLGGFEAASAMALTIAVVSNSVGPLARAADHCIAIPTGPEPIAGSTRMKAGLAQKLMLTTFSTAVMVRLGRTYDNLMIELPTAPRKLDARRAVVLMEACGLDEIAAQRLLAETGGDLKLAIVRGLAHIDNEAAGHVLTQSRGVLRDALERLGVQ